MLTGPAQRFATLGSLNAGDRASLTDEQCDEAIEWMRAYYDEGRPVYGSWFNALSRVIEGFGASFRTRSAAHLDLVQESTSPVWSELPPAEKEALLGEDLAFLAWEIRTFPVGAVICTGKTVSVHVRRLFDVVVEEEGTLARVRWWVGQGAVGKIGAHLRGGRRSQEWLSRAASFVATRDPLTIARRSLSTRRTRVAEGRRSR
jgi:hypothetical protein